MNALREVRKQAGLRQEDLARMLGTSVTYISEVENGKKNPTVKWLRRVAEALAPKLGEEVEDVLKALVTSSAEA